MKRMIILMAILSVMTISGSWMMEGCQEKLAPLGSIVPTAVPTATPIPSTQISDFQTFGSTANVSGTNINSTLTNLVAGCLGFTEYLNPASPVNGVISPTAIVQKYGDAALGDTYAARMNATWADGNSGSAGYAATWNYPSAQLFTKLYSGTTWYDIPAGTTGIKFYLYIPMMTTTAAIPNYTFQFDIGTSDTVGTTGGGLCNVTGPNSCFDNWNYTIPVNAALQSGYVLETIPLSSLTFTYTFSSPHVCSVTNNGFNDGCNSNNVVELEWQANSNAVAGNYAADFRVDDVTFY